MPSDNITTEPRDCPVITDHAALEGWPETNRRRGELFDAEVCGELSPEQAIELEHLQAVADRRTDIQMAQDLEPFFEAFGLSFEQITAQIQDLVDQLMPLDLAVWAAHLRADLRLGKVDDAELLRWANTITSEVEPGHWHESSGRLAERLGISDGAWSAMVALHRPEPAESLGDSSVDLVPYILARVGLMDDCGVWKATSREECAVYFERGRASGNHGAKW